MDRDAKTKLIKNVLYYYICLQVTLFKLKKIIQINRIYVLYCRI